MFTCQDVSRKASAFHDRELSAWDRVKMHVHLFVCDNCRRYVAQIARGSDLLRVSLRERAIDEAASDEVLRAVRVRIEGKSLRPPYDA